MNRELRRWEIFKSWEEKFYNGEEPIGTHPGHGGIVPEFDELTIWLSTQMETLSPIEGIYTANFKALTGQGELPKGMFRKLEVAWQSTS
jgi:hypothetical protein